MAVCREIIRDRNGIRVTRLALDYVGGVRISTIRQDDDIIGVTIETWISGCGWSDEMRNDTEGDAIRYHNAMVCAIRSGMRPINDCASMDE